MYIIFTSVLAPSLSCASGPLACSDEKLIGSVHSIVMAQELLALHLFQVILCRLFNLQLDLLARNGAAFHTFVIAVGAAAVVRFLVLLVLLMLLVLLVLLVLGFFFVLLVPF